MANQQLINKIKQLNSQDYSEIEIRNMLLKRGYDQTEVDEALDAVFYNNREVEESPDGGKNWLKVGVIVLLGVSLVVGGFMFVIYSGTKTIDDAAGSGGVVENEMMRVKAERECTSWVDELCQDTSAKGSNTCYDLSREVYNIDFSRVADTDDDGENESCAEVLGYAGYNCAENQYCSEAEGPEEIYEETMKTVSISLETRGVIDCSSKQISATVENTGSSDVQAANTNVFVYNINGSVVAKAEGVDLSDQGWTTEGALGQLSITGLSSSLASGNYYRIELSFVQEDYKWTIGRCLAQRGP